MKLFTRHSADVSMKSRVVPYFKSHSVKMLDLFPGHVLRLVIEIRRKFANIECGAKLIFMQDGRGESRLRNWRVVKSQNHQPVRYRTAQAWQRCLDWMGDWPSAEGEELCCDFRGGALRPITRRGEPRTVIPGGGRSRISKAGLAKRG